MTVRYTKEHHWLRSDGDDATVGITLHAQDALGDVVFVALPKIGTVFKAGDVAGTVESVKAAADIYMPADGEITTINQALADDPSLANSDPLKTGWFFKTRIHDLAQVDELMSETEYAQLVAES